MTNHPSSSGERAAVIGYSAQYRIAAELIYAALVEQHLEWIALADPDAGRLDDIQIATAGRLDAYQVKWGQQTETLTFNDLTTGKGHPSDKLSKGLIGQLAGGWRKLKNDNSERRVVVHLVSRDIASPNAKIPNNGTSISKANLQGFLVDCWTDRSWSERGEGSCPVGWSDALTALISASNIPTSDFILFIKDCEFELGYTIQTSTSTRDETRRNIDIDELAAFLFRTVGADKRVIRIEREELLNRLGWSGRFSQRFIHDFKIDKLYQPISNTISDLDRALSNHKSGYLALLGTPGSGKSTTLTHTLRYRSGFRVVRYYAYVPESFTQGRGEAVSFLHDMVFALKTRGFQGGKSQPKTTEELLEKFSNQLTELHESWLEDGVTTLILVDGLDHIQREQNPVRSLLEILPHPDTLPQGVLFVLGSQTLELTGLPSAVKSQLKTNSTRELHMRPLARSQVYSMADQAELPITLSTEQKERVYQLCAGHPLATSYLIRILAEGSNQLEIDEILVKANPYQGHVDQGYYAYWQGIEQNTSLKELLAILARLRIPFDPLELVRWSDEATVKALIKEAGYYFLKDTPHRWRFFHNSFRQFILSQTNLNILGEYDESKNQNYHRRLAELALKSPSDKPQSWEALFHLANASEWTQVLAIATQEYFRSQFYGLRSLDNIKEDISFALRAAKATHNGIAIFRYLLIEHELSERQEVLDQMDTPELIQGIFGTEAALNYLIDGSYLRVTDKVGLEFCADLISAGEFKAARLIFDASEPLELLSGAEPLEEFTEEVDLLKSWVSIAHHFRTIEEIHTAISSLRVESTNRSSAEHAAVYNKEKTKDLQKLLRQVLTTAVTQSLDIEKWNSIRKLPIEPSELKNLSHQLDFDICKTHPQHPEAKVALERILDWDKEEQLEDIYKVVLAEFLLDIKVDIEAAKQQIKDITQPATFSWQAYEWRNLEPFILRIRLNRSLVRLGHTIDSITAVPDAEDSKNHGYVIFERQLVTIASIMGRARNGAILSPQEIIRLLSPAIRLFNRSFQETNDWTGWYQLERAGNYYFELMIRAVSGHGESAIKELSSEFEKQWKNQQTAQYWATNRRLAIALELYRHGDDHKVLIRRLEDLEQEVGVWHDVYERAEEYAQLALAWREAGQLERGKALVPHLLKSTFGIYHRKDRQLQQWVELLIKTANHQPDLVIQDLGRFASALVVLEQANRGRGTQEAAIELLALAMKLNSAYAITLFEWLLDHGGIHFSSAITGLLLGSLWDTHPPIETICIICRHLLIPFDSDIYEPFLKQLAAKVASSNNSASLISELVRSIQIKSYPTERPGIWRALIVGVRKAGQDSSSLEQLLNENPGNQDSANPSLILKDGKKVTEEEVLILVKSFEQFVSLLKTVEKTEYFKWRRVIKPLINSLSEDQLNQTLLLLEPIGLDNSVRSICATRLHELGLSDKALRLLEDILRESSASGWDVSWDGGARQNTFKTLITIAPEVWRPRALETLVDDYISEFHYPVNLIHNLEELAEIIFETVPWGELWLEIRQHVFELSDFSMAEDAAPSLVANNMSVECSLLETVFWASQLPIDEVRDQVHSAICELVIGNFSPVATNKLINKWLWGSTPNSTQGIAVLDTTWMQGAKLASEYSDLILSLTSSPDFVVRSMALGLCTELDIEVKPSEARTLPIIYTIELPPINNEDRAIPFEAIRPNETYPDSLDPLEMVRPFDSELKVLSRISEIPFQNLLQRTATLMRELVPEDQWSKSAGEMFLTKLRDIDLQLPYNRQRPQVALRAISHVISELVDADCLDWEAQHFIYSKLYRYDWRLAGKEPIVRPLEISPFTPPDSYSDKNAYWIDGIQEALQSFSNHSIDGYLTVGELTMFKSLDWAVPVEHRFSMICHVDWPVSDDIRGAYDFFPYKSYWNAGDYPALPRVDQFLSMVVYGQPKQVAIGCTDWLAFNPACAVQLGWTPADDGLFRWVDGEGNIMAESIWWQDGPVKRRPPRSHDVTGAGWIVLISPEARLDILQTFSSLTRRRSVIHGFEGKDNYESAFLTDTVDWHE